ncbi:chloride channel protein [Colwellia sp. 1_MG-2023]|uniref:chloride channel protein n=1 Tax=Colwellia sp. 1_MG-2023 TaxID=3062649 RepID=UPI0026E331FF|nr:chloride channel protein [Colwellia sp. 1_MG-2023]MDO6444766.1 chloride channel protein [Colwellia sp. 1_MG-2023]
MISLTPLRKHLSLPRTSWQLCLLAAIGGACSALLVILFTLSIEGLQQFYLNQLDDYTSLDMVSRFDLPIIGAILIIIFSRITGYRYLRTGIPFVLHRLKVAHGIIPLRNTIHQFVGTVIALASGFSVGREGPAVHLGAACSSYIGSLLRLSFNTTRTLCACGIAAGISASFNTPIAAVIFVMEVILREYKVHIFIPVMIAAIVGSLITQNFFGPAHNLDYFNKIELTISHYPLIIILGMALGVLAFIFNRYLTLLVKYSGNYHIIPRLLLAAFITGGLGFFIPYAMGTDISAVNFSLAYEQHFQLLLGLLIAKMIMTVTALGLGIPGGIIGPILAIGAIAGTCASTIAMTYLPGQHIATDYALMGMAGFMAATLNAPLAALLAVVELSNQIEIIIPAMIAITSACVVSGQFLKNRSIIIMQLEVQKLLYRKPPIEKSLQRIGVLGVMQENIALIMDSSPQTVTKTFEATQGKKLVISKDNNSEHLFTWHEFVPSSESHSQDVNNDTVELTVNDKIVEHKLIPLDFQATLAEAYLALVADRLGGVYIYQDNKENILGIVSFEQIRRYLLEGKTAV